MNVIKQLYAIVKSLTMIIFQSIIYKLYDIFAVEPMIAKPSDKCKDDLKPFRNIVSL